MKRDGGLRKLIQKHLPHIHWVPIETGPTTPGVPDLNGCHAGTEVWVECKHTSGWAVDLDSFQISWISRRARAGGRVWVAVRRSHEGGPRRGPPVDSLYLVSGRYVTELSLVGLKLQDYMIAGRWTGAPSTWDWLAVANTLLGR